MSSQKRSSGIRNHFKKNSKNHKPKQMPGAFVHPREELRHYAEKKSWITDESEFECCDNSAIVHHMVHKDDCVRICKTCAHLLSTLESNFSGYQVAQNAGAILETLKFPLLYDEDDQYDKLTFEEVQKLNNIKGNPYLLPRGSILYLNRFNRTRHIERVEGENYFLAMLLAKDKYAQFAEIPIRRGSLKDIHDYIMHYYETRDKERLSCITINGIVQIEDRIYACDVHYLGKQALD
jgi:hypothetical protein